MRWIHAVAAAVAATGLVATTAHATLTGVTMVRVPIAPPVNSNTGELGNYSVFPRVFDLKINQADGEHWTVQTLKAALTAGTFFSPAVGNGDYLVNAPTGTTVDYDTALTSPDGTSGQVVALGQSDFAGQGSVGKGIMPGAVPVGRDPNIDNTTTQNTSINITWGEEAPFTAASPVSPGTAYTVARITVLGKSVGTISNGHLTGTAHLNAAPPDLSYNALNIPLNGDFNGDALANGGDITAFIGALSNITQYHLDFPAAAADTSFIGDFNNDGLFNGGDITGFINYLSFSGAPPLSADQLSQLGALVPEPSSLCLLGLGAWAAMGRRRK